SHQPKYPQFIFVKDYLRAGMQIDTKHICAMVDTITGQADTVTQSFAGRACGYGKQNDNVYIFTNKDNIQKYIDWVKSGFDSQSPPTAKNVKTSSTYHRTQEIPRIVEVCDE